MLQVLLYKEILRSKTVASLLSSSDSKEGVLHIITTLKKLCNHPDLLRTKGEAIPKLQSLHMCMALNCHLNDGIPVSVNLCTVKSMCWQAAV